MLPLRCIVASMFLLQCSFGLSPLASSSKSAPMDEVQTVVAKLQLIEHEPLTDKSRWARVDLIHFFEHSKYLACPNLLGPLLESKHKEAGFIWFQMILASGVYLLQNPEAASDEPRYVLAGVESALRAYEAILKKKPKLRVELLDTLVLQREQGKLRDWVSEHMCKRASE